MPSKSRSFSRIFSTSGGKLHVTEVIVQFVAQREQRGEPAAAPFRDVAQDGIALAQFFDVDEFAAHLREAAARGQQRRELLLRERVAGTADEDVHFEFEPIRVFGRALGDDVDVEFRLAADEVGQARIETSLDVGPAGQHVAHESSGAVGAVQARSRPRSAARIPRRSGARGASPQILR